MDHLSSFIICPQEKIVPCRTKKKIIKVHSSLNGSKRGKYKIFSPMEKMRCVTLANLNGLKKASQVFQVAEKNIKRWICAGVQRKKGAGRKVQDQTMEEELLQWIEKKALKNRKFPDNKNVKAKAKSLSKVAIF